MKIEINIPQNLENIILEAADAVAEELGGEVNIDYQNDIVAFAIECMIDAESPLTPKGFNRWFNADKYSDNGFEDAVKNNLKSKGDWEFEISSGFDGYRCQKCKTWIYANQKLKCDCDNDNHDYRNELGPDGLAKITGE
jgi:hypothetical protein